MFRGLHANSFKHFKTVGLVTDLLTITQTNPETHSECSKALPICSAGVSQEAKSARRDWGLSYLYDYMINVKAKLQLY